MTSTQVACEIAARMMVMARPNEIIFFFVLKKKSRSELFPRGCELNDIQVDANAVTQMHEHTKPKEQHNVEVSRFKTV